MVLMEGEQGISCFTGTGCADPTGVETVGRAVGTPVGFRPVVVWWVVGKRAAADAADDGCHHS